MMRICFHLKVKTDRIEEYKEAHRNVWPELLEEIKRAGIRNYSIFMWKDGHEFGFLECDDWDAACAYLAKSEVNARWQEWMKEYLDTPVDMSAESPMELLEEVFHLD